MTGQQGGRGIRASFYSTIAKQQAHPATKQDNLDLLDVCAKLLTLINDDDAVRGHC